MVIKLFLQYSFSALPSSVLCYITPVQNTCLHGVKGKITNYKSFVRRHGGVQAIINVFCTVAGVCLFKLDALVLCTHVRCSECVGVIYSTYFYCLLITENRRLSTLPYVNFVNVCLNRFTCVALFESLIWLKGRGQMLSRLSWHVFDHGVNVCTWCAAHLRSCERKVVAKRASYACSN